MVNISINDKSISWKEFREKFEQYFPYSFEPQRVAKMQEAYEKLTGKKKGEFSRSEKNDKQTKGNDNGSNAKASVDEPKG